MKNIFNILIYVKYHYLKVKDGQVFSTLKYLTLEGYTHVFVNEL